jgi:pyruvate,water dikinase
MAETSRKKSAGAQARDARRILWLKEISISDIPLVGGKNASLGEMYVKLVPKGIRVPNGFAVTTAAYWEFLTARGLDAFIKKTLSGLDTTDVATLAAAGAAIRATILKAALPDALQREIISAYGVLCGTRTDLAVAVRSSATAEDLPDASFAGQQETYLNVQGGEELLLAVKQCIASLYTDRAISYRETKGVDHRNVALSVTVQEMVRSDAGSSGVLFTLDTESGFSGVVLINASYGRGEYVVKGQVTPDQYYVFKEGVRQAKRAIISKILGSKSAALVCSAAHGTKNAAVPKARQNRWAISDDDILVLARWGVEIEAHYGRPQDIEWAKDGNTGELFIVQARPETVKARAGKAVIESYRLKSAGKVLATGTAVGQKIGAGRAHIIEHPRDMARFKQGEVLVTRMTDPDWEPIMRMAAAIITEEGGKTSHAAIVSRELGVPCLVGVKNARKIIADRQPITVSCAEGDEGRVYRGILPFEVKKTEIGTVAKTKTKMMMNVGDPDNAFALSALPCDGVGLAREEFIFTNFIRIHPLALLHYRTLTDAKAKKAIAELTRGYADKAAYCVDKLAEGIGRIATAFYPNPVIIRFSDFKTNEYATLIGGKQFEPKEENPMIGWRGASRYYSPEYEQGFRLECEAMKKVRNEWGLTNVVAMIPFCRTPEEGEKVLATMAQFGLKRGDNGLKVYVMCEIPSNVILAREFAKIFDGFSIGSNDLTQLTLGVDRDSAVVRPLYDEQNKAVKTLIRDVIRVAHECGRPVGICGQAPSDYPAFAEFLIREGIDSISLNPDTLMATRERIAAVEKTVGKRGKKTHAPTLALVAAFGAMAASLVSLGAGCDNRPAADAGLALASPRALREQFVERAVAEKDAARLAETSTLREDTFAAFSLDYPAWWSVAHWSGGVTLRDDKSGEYISIFRQMVSHPVADSEKVEFLLAGKRASRMAVPLAEGNALSVVEVGLDNDDVLELNGNGAAFERALRTFSFGGDATLPDRPLTHWDIREGRACVQVVTYAKKINSASCEAFPTPCDVPDGWSVCDAGDR